MDCILKVIKGPDAGASCKLQPGPNLVGRSIKATLKLTPSDISWEHISVQRNGDMCIAENLSASGSYLDDARLSGPVKLRPRDQLRLSKETVLRFETTGGADPGKRRMMGMLLILFVAVGVVVWAMGSDDQGSNWDSAYTQIADWAQERASTSRLPADVPKLFINGWRLEQANDFVNSRATWLRLKLLLDSADARYGFSDRATEHPHALQYMLTPPPGPQAEMTDEIMYAALDEFVARRLSWSTLQAQSK